MPASIAAVVQPSLRLGLSTKCRRLCCCSWAAGSPHSQAACRHPSQHVVVLLPVPQHILQAKTWPSTLGCALPE